MRGKKKINPFGVSEFEDVWAVFRETYEGLHSYLSDSIGLMLMSFVFVLGPIFSLFESESSEHPLQTMNILNANIELRNGEVNPHLLYLSPILTQFFFPFVMHLEGNDACDYYHFW